MPTSRLLQCFAALMVALPLYGFADSFNVKTGAWEMTTTAVSTGNFMPPEMLARMSPEQRARMERAMQAHSGKPTTAVDKHCVTKEDLDQDGFFKSDNENQCSRKIVQKSATRVVLEQTCGAPRASTATVIVEIQTPESVTTAIDIVMAGGNGKVHMQGHGRWLGASCAGIKQGN
ncbi:MAG: DUF3617 domain-containing protein [Rhodoferax sp.]